MSTIIDALDRAISIAGSQGRLARAAGVSQPSICKARLRQSVSPRLAIRIERATGISRALLCPDVFDQADIDVSTQPFRPTLEDHDGG